MDRRFKLCDCFKLCQREWKTCKQENRHFWCVQDAIERYMQSPITYYDLPYDKVELVKGSDNHSCTEGDFKLEVRIWLM